MSHFSKALAAVAALALVFAAGCVNNPPAPTAKPQDEALLVSAGFKAIVASTPQQQQHLATLPGGQVTVVSQTGRNYFVYPDKARNQIYVGTEKEYQAYQTLRAQNNLPNVNVEASYAKEDKALREADKRDASVTWGFWPGFSGLGWQ